MKILASAFAVAFSAASPAQPADPVPVELARNSFVGSWTDTGDCNEVTVLLEDGTFVAPNGARGDWGIHRSTLKLSGPGGVVTWTVHFDTPAQMVLIGDDGSRSTSTRCDAAEMIETI